MKIEHEKVDYEEPEILIENVLQIEEEIRRDLDKLRKMM